jgi:Holliday junction resolvase
MEDETMTKSMAKERKKSGKAAASMPEKEMLTHLPGIRVVKNGKIPAGVAESEIHDLAYLRPFALCACYLGYVDMKIREENRIDIPVDAVWELFNFTTALRSAPAIDRHLMIIARAIELLGFKADIFATDEHDIVIDRISALTSGDDGEIVFKYIRFNRKGMDPDEFCRLLMHC